MLSFLVLRHIQEHIKVKSMHIILQKRNMRQQKKHGRM